MSYSLEERAEDGSMVTLGAAFEDLIVAKVIAARRAARNQRLTVVREVETGTELVRHDPGPLARPVSVVRLRAAAIANGAK